MPECALLKSLMVTTGINASNPSGCLLASFLTVAVPSVLSRVLDISWGQWRINHGAHGAPAPGTLRLGALKIENENVLLIKTKS